MSLKAFHLFFISVSVLLCFGFGAWCFMQGQMAYPAAGAVSLLIGLGLIWYEVKFLKKFNEMERNQK
jgi:hypothetical protein